MSLVHLLAAQPGQDPVAHLTGQLRWFTVALAAFGFGLCLLAWFVARRPGQTAGPRSGIISSVGAGLMTGAAVSFSVVLMQEALQRAAAEADWRTSVVNSWKIAGFDPRDHEYRDPDINFSGKELPNAIFKGLDLDGMQFQDAQLDGADFREAGLSGANFIGADLSTADIAGANFSGAQLQSADLSEAAVEQVESFEGASVNAKTCWPIGFLNGKQVAERRSGLEAKPTYIDGELVTSIGHEPPCTR